MTLNRIDPPYVADERTMLTAWLEWQRATLARKCAGLGAEDLRRRSVEPSTLSLLGLVRHMADVERGWFRRCLLGEDVPPLHYSRDNPDGDFDDVDSADVGDAFARWEQECEAARHAISDTDYLDVTGTTRSGDIVSLRWILVHMIEEYARHNGHADLLRERIDGAVGD